ncbi:hypothetical protein QJS04_geneDACA023695 [Acorus gramineus]|uniref:Uncharacterized protein n=1 Tax=Acorus gramineus TaxID=55184 RepID=A0AAV9BRQ0_ACOGR|nr:hypothetical protein QJS04_geneDACA023695 [Acorus gramineus]
MAVTKTKAVKWRPVKWAGGKVPRKQLVVKTTVPPPRATGGVTRSGCEGAPVSESSEEGGIRCEGVPVSEAVEGGRGRVQDPNQVPKLCSCDAP